MYYTNEAVTDQINLEDDHQANSNSNIIFIEY